MVFIKLLAITLLSGCVWLNSEKDVVVVSPLPKVDNKLQLKMVWNCSVGSGIGKFYSNLHPAYQDSLIFAADRVGIIKAIDKNTGKVIWSTDLSIHTGFFSKKHPAKLSGGIAVEGSRIYIGSELAKVYALDVHTGRVVWEIKVAGEALSTPVISEGMILIHTSNGMLQALNESDGMIKWTVNLDLSSLKLRGESSPASAFGAAIVGSDSGLVSAIMLNQGQLIWKQCISQLHGNTEIAKINDIKTTPIIVNGIVYILAYNGNFAALDLKSGQVIWSQAIGSIRNLLVVNDWIYIVDQNDYVIAVDIHRGFILWRQSELLHRNLTSPVLYNGYIIVGDSKGYLHGININDGSFVAQYKVDRAGLLAAPLVAGEKLIVQTINGKVYAITL